MDYPTHAGYTPLHYAAAARASAAAAALFRHGADPNARCGPGGFDWVLYPAGSTALHICAWRNCLDIAMMLLQYWVGRTGRDVKETKQGCRPWVPADADVFRESGLCEGRGAAAKRASR